MLGIFRRLFENVKNPILLVNVKGIWIIEISRGLGYGDAG